MEKELSLYQITGAFPMLMQQEEMNEEEKEKVKETEQDLLIQV